MANSDRLIELTTPVFGVHEPVMNEAVIDRLVSALGGRWRPAISPA